MVIDSKAAAPALRSCSLFAGLDESLLSLVIGNARCIDLADGDLLFDQHQRASDIFWLESGQIKLSRISSAGGEKVIELVFPGQSFAEAVMFSKETTYPVAATAIGKCSVWAIDSQYFSGVLSQSTKACFNIMAELSRRLHQQITEIDHLTLHNAADRLVYFLCDALGNSEEAGMSRIHLSTQKQVIASRLSVTPETLSRTLAKLQKEGLIEQIHGDIVITDIERLRRYAGSDE